MHHRRRAIVCPVRTHQDIDQRSLALAHAIVAAVDRDANRGGLEKARGICARWLAENPSSAVIKEWSRILGEDWNQVRAVLLDEGEFGQRLRQSSPFCGVLTPEERWAIYRRFRHEPKAA